jgi:hypothetical protein
LRAKAAGRNLWVPSMVVLALLCPQLLGAEPKPLVAIEFRIEARNIQRNLHKNIGAFEKELSRLVADLSTNSQSFLTWRPVTEVQDHSQLAAILHVSLREVEGAIMLHFSAEAREAGQRFDCYKAALGAVSFGPVNDLDRSLFTRLESQPTGRREALKQRIRNVLDHREFQDTLANVFARSIPICHTAKLQGDFVAVCLKESDLEMDEKSKMLLSVCSRIPEDQGNRRGGSLELEAAIETGIYSDSDSGIQARVTSCFFGAFEKELCRTKIPLMLEKRLDHSLNVFMTGFILRYSNTQGNRVTTPLKG